MTGPSPSLAVYRARRERIGERLREEGGVLILHGGDLVTRSNDTDHRFRPDSDFHYLTGMCEPGAVLVLRPTENGVETIAFVRPRDPAAEVWTGRRAGPEGVVRYFGIDRALTIAELDAELWRLIDGAKVVHLAIGRHPTLDRKVFAVGKRLHDRSRWGESPPLAYGDARVLLGEERLRKDKGALESLKKAIELSASAHVAAMKTVRSGMHEYELEALIEYEFRRAGSSGPGYGTIVGAGDNATILHYVENDAEMRAGQLVLVDAGAEWDYFSGDITRTFPVDGRFRGEQRALYEVVLRANLAAIDLAVVGGNIEVIHRRALEVLCDGLRELRFVDESIDVMLEKKLYEAWYMHRTSHWLGVDVHDAGRYTLARTPRPLEPGFVLTIEPGLYVRADDERVPAGFRGTGVRIEDDVLITEAGPKILSSSAPKTIADIEAVAAEGR